MIAYLLNKNTHTIEAVEVKSIDTRWVYYMEKTKHFSRLQKKAIDRKHECYYKDFEDAVERRKQLISLEIKNAEKRINILNQRLGYIPSNPNKKNNTRTGYIKLKCTVCEQKEEVHRSAVPASERKRFTCVNCIEAARKRALKHAAYTAEDVNSALHIVKFGRIGAITKNAKRGAKYLLSLRYDERRKITGKDCSEQYIQELFEM